MPNTTHGVCLCTTCISQYIENYNLEMARDEVSSKNVKLTKDRSLMDLNEQLCQNTHWVWYGEFAQKFLAFEKKFGCIFNFFPYDAYAEVLEWPIAFGCSIILEGKERVKFKFICEPCRKSWTSNEGTMKFFVLHNPTAARYDLVTRFFGQKCAECVQKCKSHAQFISPIWYPTEICKVMRRLSCHVARLLFRDPTLVALPLPTLSSSSANTSCASSVSDKSLVNSTNSTNNTRIHLPHMCQACHENQCGAGGAASRHTNTSVSSCDQSEIGLEEIPHILITPESHKEHEETRSLCSSGRFDGEKENEDEDEDEEKLSCTCSHFQHLTVGTAGSDSRTLNNTSDYESDTQAHEQDQQQQNSNSISIAKQFRRTRSLQNTRTGSSCTLTQAESTETIMFASTNTTNITTGAAGDTGVTSSTGPTGPTFTVAFSTWTSIGEHDDADDDKSDDGSMLNPFSNKFQTV